MERDLWMAGRMKEYRKLPLEPDTVLFIEDYSCGAAGIVSKLFLDALTDPAYKDCRLVWTARDYESVLDQFGELVEDDRVWIVIRGMPDFIRALATATKIYCANTLPNYFIKRDGQTICTSLQLSIFVSSCYTKNQIKNFVRTLNDTDYFLCADDGFDDAVLRKDYGISQDRIKYFSLKDLVKATDSPKDKIIIAINRDARLTKSCAAFASFVKRIEAVAGFYDMKVLSFTGLSFWKKYSKQKNYFGIENVYCDEMNLTRYYGEAGLFITDSILRAIQAQRFNIPVILWRGKAFSEQLELFLKNVVRASDYTTIYKTMEDLFGGLGLDGEYLYYNEPESEDDEDDEDDVGRYDEATQDGDTGKGTGTFEERVASNTESSGDEDNDEGLDDVSRENGASRTEVFCRRESYPAENREKYLYLLRWEKDEDYPEMVGRWLDYVDDGTRDITLLFLNSGSSALYPALPRFKKPHRVACRVGYYQSSAEERAMIVDKSDSLADYLENESHEFIEDEWKRLLGNIRYDHIIADKTTIFFWNAMYRYPPTDDFVIMSNNEKKKMLDIKIEEEVTDK